MPLLENPPAMNRLVWTLIIATVAILPSCSSDSITSTPDEQETTGSTATAGGDAEASVGDTITLHGELEPGLEIATTVASVVDPAKGFFKAEEGTRYVAVEVHLENTGSIDYGDAPTNGAVLIDESSHQYDTWIGSGVELNLDGLVRLAPGDERVGYIVFQVPRSETPASIQFTLESGFASETGEWSL